MIEYYEYTERRNYTHRKCKEIRKKELWRLYKTRNCLYNDRKCEMNLQDKSCIPIFSGKWTFQLSKIKNPFKITFPFLPFQNPCIKLDR